MRERRRAHRFPGCAARRWITPSEPQGQSCPLPHPGGRRPQAPSEPALVSSASLTASTPQASNIRGSITRPARSLCTLRSRGPPRTTQHSVPAGGQPWPGRSLTCRVVLKVSVMCLPLHVFPLSRLCLAQQRVSIEMDSRIRGNDGLRTTVGECGLSSLAVNISYTPLRSENPVFCVVNAWKSGSP